MGEDLIYIPRTIWESMLKKNFWKKNQVVNLNEIKMLMKSKWAKLIKTKSGQKKKLNNKMNRKILIKTEKAWLR